ncbi:MAG: hypothetical protein N3I35_01900 [Clostridia bacterium]|nr:hypothetical protein [Clostridia bacterium]
MNLRLKSRIPKALLKTHAKKLLSGVWQLQMPTYPDRFVIHYLQGIISDYQWNILLPPLTGLLKLIYFIFYIIISLCQSKL